MTTKVRPVAKLPFVPHAARPEWHDVSPVPQEESEGALCTIMYTPQFSSAMDMFRAVCMGPNAEFSQRTLDLSSELIALNPAHYTIWSFRYRCALALGRTAQEELEWSQKVAGKQPKNYQIWQFRRKIIVHFVDEIGGGSANLSSESLKSLLTEELDFSQQILALDAKNYHTWSFRQWLIHHFAIWDDSKLSELVHWQATGAEGPGEIYFTNKLLKDDVRNNSAFNHRFFMITHGGNCNPSSRGRQLDAEMTRAELDYVKKLIELAPNNISAWSYFRGILLYTKTPRRTQEYFVKPFVQRPEPVVQAMSFMLDLHEEEKLAGVEAAADIQKLVHLLAQHDWVRSKYWRWRGDNLLQEPA